MNPIQHIVLIVFLLLPCSNAWSWDATGHRFSAYIAWELMPPETRDNALKLIQAHPRYQVDFSDAMPLSILNADDEQQARWLFGQAAVWPDLIRSIETPEEREFDRPNWHWIDGRWIRSAIPQGNVYVGHISRSDIQGIAANEVKSETDATNIMLALDWNLSVLNNRLSSSAEKSVALCWVLHLVADIHQPLHTGALVSLERFPDGDRGGNGIPTVAGNLHSLWDQALRSQPFDDTLSRLHASAAQSPISLANLDSGLWLTESRQIMQEFAYPDEIKTAVLRSERLNQRLKTLSLDDDYTSQMRAISEDRLSVSGLRLAAQLRTSLGD